MVAGVAVTGVPSFSPLLSGIVLPSVVLPSAVMTYLVP
jgi:hypothetical protein